MSRSVDSKRARQRLKLGGHPICHDGVRQG